MEAPEIALIESISADPAHPDAFRKQIVAECRTCRATVEVLYEPREYHQPTDPLRPTLVVGPRLLDAELAAVRALEAKCPHVEQVRQFARDTNTMRKMRGLPPEPIAPWLGA